LGPEKEKHRSIGCKQAAMSKDLDQQHDHYKEIALKNLGLCRSGLQRGKKHCTTSEELKDNGFDVQSGGCGIPTSFVANIR
jgi:hypothetical protein